MSTEIKLDRNPENNHQIHIYEPKEHVGFFIVVEVWPEFKIDFKCYEVCAQREDKDGNPTEFKFHVPPKHGEGSPTASTFDYKMAEIALAGDLKWDETMRIAEYSLDMFYDRNHASRLGKLIDRLYDIAEELLPNFDGPKNRSSEDADGQSISSL